MKKYPDPIWSHKAQRFVGGTAGVIMRMSQDGGYYQHMEKFANFLHEDGAFERFEQKHKGKYVIQIAK